MSLVTIDFEASCLPRHGRSYPIEVGIADARGSRAWLIRPHKSWTGWDWTEEAEQLHGITHDQLLRDGQSVEHVALALNEVLAGRRVVADSNLDSYWLGTLCTAANILPTFSLSHVAIVLDELGATATSIVTAQSELDQQGFLRHRARHDACWLFALLEMISDGAVAPGHTVGTFSAETGKVSADRSIYEPGPA